MASTLDSSPRRGTSAHRSNASRLSTHVSQDEYHSKAYAPMSSNVEPTAAHRPHSARLRAAPVRFALSRCVAHTLHDAVYFCNLSPAAFRTAAHLVASLRIASAN